MTDKISGRRVIITPHAAQRLQERNISKSDVIRGIRYANITTLCADGVRTRFVNYVDGGNLHIIAKVTNNEYFVVTAFRDTL